MRINNIGFKHAIRGIIVALQTELNMKIHVISMLIVIFTGFMLKVTVVEWLFLIGAIGLVITTELVNTSIENITDQLFKGHHEVAKNIKDISAGAVLVASITAAIIGIVILLPRIVIFF
ncbi:diacylglycerol kinase family protein [Filobacillus milosensis]|uniref:Diacylglycerol kinase family protein n=1 Tax=Filobacillus milosensis TaxID=94137 RepID=A0A4Y8ISC3_9BACI|nr:diacylglycerol kinase family protein [Filobacillus milosensis]TFB24838.1 diacylglycerol kinase family protein [Filobacillus milosensis]